MGIIYC